MAYCVLTCGQVEPLRQVEGGMVYHVLTQMQVEPLCQVEGCKSIMYSPVGRLSLSARLREVDLSCTHPRAG